MVNFLQLSKIRTSWVPEALCCNTLCSKVVTFLSTAYSLFSGKCELWTNRYLYCPHQMTEVSVCGLFCVLVFMKTFMWAFEDLTFNKERSNYIWCFDNPWTIFYHWNECISGYPMIILPGKLEPLLWDKTQQTVVNETLIELSKHHLYQQANR